MNPPTFGITPYNEAFSANGNYSQWLLLAVTGLTSETSATGATTVANKLDAASAIAVLCKIFTCGSLLVAIKMAQSHPV